MVVKRTASESIVLTDAAGLVESPHPGVLGMGCVGICRADKNSSIAATAVSGAIVSTTVVSMSKTKPPAITSRRLLRAAPMMPIALAMNSPPEMPSNRATAPSLVSVVLEIRPVHGPLI
jgi:hypothetical protein